MCYRVNRPELVGHTTEIGECFLLNRLLHIELWIIQLDYKCCFYFRSINDIQLHTNANSFVCVVKLGCLLSCNFVSTQFSGKFVNVEWWTKVVLVVALLCAPHKLSWLVRSLHASLFVRNNSILSYIPFTLKVSTHQAPTKNTDDFSFVRGKKKKKKTEQYDQWLVYPHAVDLFIWQTLEKVNSNSIIIDCTAVRHN